MNEPISKVRARYGASIVVGGVLFVGLLVLDPWLNVLSIREVALDDLGIRAALFGALIGVAGIFLTVLLAVLAVVTSLDAERRVVRVMKEMHVYDELIHRLVGPVFTVMALAILSIACLLLPARESLGTDWWTGILPAATLSLALGTFVQTGLVAKLLGKVLLFKGHAPDATETPQAARVRIEDRLAEDGPPPQKTPKKRLQRAAATG